MTRQKSRQRLFNIRLSYKNGDLRTVVIKASNAETAIARALKRNPSATDANVI